MELQQTDLGSCTTPVGIEGDRCEDLAEAYPEQWWRVAPFSSTCTCMQTPKDLARQISSNSHVAIIRPGNTRAGTAAGVVHLRRPPASSLGIGFCRSGRCKSAGM
jgi:hypothetical protein